MKKILFITTHFPPSRSVGTQRILKICKYLPKYNWEIFILTQKEKYYPYNEGPDNFELKSVLKNVKVFRTSKIDILDYLFRMKHKNKKEKVKSNNSSTLNKSNSQHLNAKSKTSLWQKIKDAITWLLQFPDKDINWLPISLIQALRIIRKYNIDVIFTSCPPHSVHLNSLFLKILTKKKVIVDFRDPWDRSQWEPLNSTRREKFQKKVDEFAEKWTIKKVDKAIFVTQELKDEFLNNYGTLSKDKFTVFYNGYDPDSFSIIPQNNLKNANITIFTHTGTLYKKRDPSPIFYAVENLIKMKSIERDDIRLRFIGTISRELQDITSKVVELGIEDIVEFKEKVSYKESFKYMVESDVLILLQPGTRLQIPAKIYDYMAIANPILAIGEKSSSVQNMVENKLGLFVDYNSIEDIQNGILEFLNNNNVLSKEKLKRNRSQYDISKNILKLDSILSN